MHANPTDTAIHIATILDRDLIAAGQVKNYIAPSRLAEVLGLTADDLKPRHPYGDGQLVMQDPQPLAELEGNRN